MSSYPSLPMSSYPSLPMPNPISTVKSGQKRLISGDIISTSKCFWNWIGIVHFNYAENEIRITFLKINGSQ